MVTRRSASAGEIGFGVRPAPRRRGQSVRAAVPPIKNLSHDGTLEGMQLVDAPAFSVQYHRNPLQARDARGLFDRFAG